MTTSAREPPSNASASSHPSRRSKHRRVLVFPAGTEIGLEIFAALHGYPAIELFGAGEAVSNHARFVFPAYYEIPSVHAANWLKQLIKICQQLGIQYVFPAHDDVVIALSSARNKIPARVITSSDDVCQTTRSKSATYRRLASVVRVPELFGSANQVSSYPVIVKPDRGQGSIDVRRVDNAQELACALRNVQNPIISEFLPGDEYTIDCFSSATDGLMFVGARRRNRMRNGISIHTETVDLPDAHTLAVAIDAELKPRGAWFFQVKRSLSGELALLEVAPRIAGSMAAHRVTGMNFPLLSLLDADGERPCIFTNPGRVVLDRPLCNRYRSLIHFDAAYMDLEETLLHHDTLDEKAMQLICACLNQKIYLALITEQGANMGDRILHKVRGLFDEIIQVHSNQPRSCIVGKARAIYVDNNASRRLEVNQSLHIPTFDASMLELLTLRAQDTKLRSSNS